MARAEGAADGQTCVIGTDPLADQKTAKEVVKAQAQAETYITFINKSDIEVTLFANEKASGVVKSGETNKQQTSVGVKWVVKGNDKIVAKSQGQTYECTCNIQNYSGDTIYNHNVNNVEP